MAFWGIEVKPGTPHTHQPLKSQRKAPSLPGIGSAIDKSIVQCNVGNKSPVFVCCLFPEKTECCQLNLGFEEANEVVFSVIGSRSVHLTGYFMRTPSPHHPNDDELESEDIGETDSQRSDDRKQRATENKTTRADLDIGLKEVVQQRPKKFEDFILLNKLAAGQKKGATGGVEPDRQRDG